MKMSSPPKVFSDHSDILASELVEINRQEIRTDNKATHIITLAGILLTLSVASAGVIYPFASSLSWWMLIPGLPLLASAAFWIATITELLRHVLRPSLQSPIHGGFMDPNRYEYFKTISLEEYRLAKVRFFNELLVRRYKSLQKAVNLLLLGFVFTGMSLFGATLLAFLVMTKDMYI